MDPKPQPNHKIYIQALQKMSPERKLLKVFELSEFTRQVYYAGLKNRHPELPESELKKIYLKGLSKCHNRNY